MRPAMLRPIALRAAARTARAPHHLSRPNARRAFASEAPGEADKARTPTMPKNPTSHSSKAPIFIIGGVVIALVAGRYILASDKSFGSGQAEIKAARKELGTSEERRDPRDSGVKTLEQKKQKEQSS